jgi:hypothetical protein
MLKLSYDSNGKVVSVAILNIGGYSNVPINLESFLVTWEPTTDLNRKQQQYLQSAWNEWLVGKDLSVELRDRPDLVVRNVDWQQILDELDVQAVGGNGFFEFLAQANLNFALSSLAIFQRVKDLAAEGKDISKELRTLQWIFGVMGQIVPDHISLLNEVILRNGLVF